MIRSVFNRVALSWLVGADSNGRWVGAGGLMKRLSRCEASGCISTAPWTDRATPWSSI